MNSRAAIILAAGAAVIVAIVIIGSAVRTVKDAGTAQEHRRAAAATDAPEEPDATPLMQKPAGPAPPPAQMEAAAPEDIAAPEEPDAVTYMERPAPPAPQPETDAAAEDAPATPQDLASEIEEPSTVPLMQRPAPPAPDGQAQAGEQRGLAAGISPTAPLEKGREAQLTLHLEDADGKPVPSSALEESHGRKIHLFVIDESLADYHHLFPASGEGDGTYVFSFTPATDRNYMVYAGVQPAGGEAQMIPVLLSGAQPCDGPCVERAAVFSAEAGGVKASVSFDAAPVRAGSPVHAEISLTDADGKPLSDLEPCMGAYAHIAGFYEGFAAVAHIHPLGAEPQGGADRGASPLSFVLHPAMPGYLRYFVQVRRDGKDVFLPFGLFVEP